ncbi:uncharacterized protein Dana_GF18553 [Drosophila ananassae]|uniref:Retinoblastoma family protein n=1 Tax=Drosophila ananassae TaxID=7217 RepID=B3M3A0_DROAN|nr:retinoblastoma family protein [Drosophila ananassae]EDV43561.1 uncharacterized protein Dana_GF18553 [Drosophila ananassae]
MNICEVDAQPDALLQRYYASCELLELDPKIQISAMATYRRFDADGSLAGSGGDDMAQEWLCCSVYSELQRVKIREMREESKRGAPIDPSDQIKSSCWNLSLTRLLRSFKVNVSQFLRRMEHWNWLAQNEGTLQLEVEELQRRLGITLTLRKHYKHIFEKLFVQPAEDADSEAVALYMSLYEFGWLLFLVIRNELPGFATSSLVSGCQVLVCSMDLLYVNVLEVSRSEVIRRDFAGVPPKWDSEDFDSTLLTKYSALEAIVDLIPQLPAKGVTQMKKAFFHKALMVLFMDHILLGNNIHMREIVKEGMLDVNLGTLNRKYDTHVADISEMDERVLLCFQELKEKPKDPKSVTLSISTTSTTFSTSKHKKLLSQSLPLKLAPNIVERLQDDGKSVIKHLEQTLKSMGQKFSAAAKDYITAQEADERFRLASGLYYKLIDKIVTSEIALKPWLKISKLIKQPTLNETLLACCLEVALHVHHEDVDGLKFPFILDCYSLEAYDFQKILEVVVRHDQGLLGRELVKHLHALEEECLGSLIFRKNSQLWRSFGKALHLPGYQDVQAEGKENASTGAEICLRKFYELAKRRLFVLCQSIGLVDNFARIWHLAEHSFTTKGGQLLRQRSVDQLLLCAIHLHARLEELRLTFSAIIQHYRRQPHARSSVYRAVAMNDGQTGDIIRFYNRIYVRTMGTFGRLLHCQEPLGNKLKKDPNVLLEASPIEARVGRNICVSSPSPPNVCVRESCSAITLQIDRESSPVSEEAPNLKRTLSNKELGVIKRPNILRRRTCFQ